jgi:hypothetical protein
LTYCERTIIHLIVERRQRHIHGYVQSQKKNGKLETQLKHYSSANLTSSLGNSIKGRNMMHLYQ